MYGQIFQRLLLVSTIALGLMLVPALGFGQTDADTTDRSATSDTAVTIEDMTADDAQQQDTTFAQQQEDAEQQEEDVIDDDDMQLARTVGINALWGTAAGSLIGLGVYLLTGFEASPWIIAQFAGGGLLVGSTVGLVTALTGADEPAPRALDERPSSTDWVEQQAPETFDIPVLQGNF